MSRLGVKGKSATEALLYLAKAVKQMRYMQKNYFRTRSQADLQACKGFEKDVDDAVDHLLNFRTFSFLDQPAEPTAPQEAS